MQNSGEKKLLFVGLNSKSAKTNITSIIWLCLYSEKVCLNALQHLPKCIFISYN